MRCNMITADAQYLGLPLLQPAVIAPEGHSLLRSPTGEVKDVKLQYHVLAPVVLAQGNIALTHRGEHKIRGDFAHFCRHGFVLL